MPALRAPALLALFVCLMIAGCNAFAPFDQQSLSDDPDQLLADADHALQNDRADDAVRFLRRALEIAPGHRRAQIKLSTALLAQHQIDAYTIVRISQTISGHGSSGPGLQQLGISAQNEDLENSFCSFPTDHDATSFDPRSIDRFNEFQPSQEALTEIRGLITTVMDSSYTNVGDFDGSDIQGVVDTLRNDGLTDDEIAEAMVNDAVAHMTLAYLDISESARDNYDFYYVDPPEGTSERYLGYCAPTQEQLDEAEEVAACNISSIAYSKDLLVERADYVLDAPEGSLAQELSSEAVRAYEVFERELDATCSNS